MEWERVYSFTSPFTSSKENVPQRLKLQSFRGDDGLKSLREDYARGVRLVQVSHCNKLFALYQGTTLVVPLPGQNGPGFSPCRREICI